MLYEEVREGFAKSLGTDHPGYLTTLHEAVRIKTDQHDLSGAMKLPEKGEQRE